MAGLTSMRHSHGALTKLGKFGVQDMLKEAVKKLIDQRSYGPRQRWM